MRRALIVHGGAWNIPDELVEPHLRGCRSALEAGWKVLLEGGPADAAVEAAVRVMEDDPAFDAGVGSFLTREGTVELDASMMRSSDLAAGAVAGVTSVRNPISLVRQIMKEDPNIFYVGEAAHRLARKAGLPLCDPSELIIDRERQRWERLRQEPSFDASRAFVPGGTVGAVALDVAGELVAGTSTGGTPFKPSGRVGDSPLIGCGTYADGKGGASATGLGEAIIQVCLARMAVEYMSHDNPPQAARKAVLLLTDRTGGRAGLILLDHRGEVGWYFNTPRMAYGYIHDGLEEPVVSCT